MNLEPIKVVARWEAENRFEIRRFIYRDQTYQPESTGRQWEDERGLHVLCMIPGGQVFELVFSLNPAGWWINPPVSGIGIA